MSKKSSHRAKPSVTRSTPATATALRTVPAKRPSRRWLAAGFGTVAVAALIVVAAVALSGSSKPSATAAPIQGTVVQATGGSWTNVTADQLASMLTQHDFTLLNVKTPYSGEIAGTDLYIPYDQLAAQAARLPTTKDARVVVYCRSGHESAMAAQTLIDLGYTNVYNLDGGMTAWTASGRQLVTLDRSGG